MTEEFVVVRRADLERLLQELDGLKRLLAERRSDRLAGSGQAAPAARS